MEFDLHAAIQRFVFAIFFLFFVLVRFMKARQVNLAGHKMNCILFSLCSNWLCIPFVSLFKSPVEVDTQ